MRAEFAFRSQRDVLTRLVQHDLPNIASKLYAKSIISAVALSEAVNHTHTASDRTVSLLSVVEDRIGAEPHVFTEFVQILESEPTLRSQASQMVENYLDFRLLSYRMSYVPDNLPLTMSITSKCHFNTLS